MDYRDRDFTGEQVTLDCNKYSGCVFNRCAIRFFGAGDVALFTNKFKDCTWEFVGPAGSALKMLRMLYHGGAQGLVEQTIEGIRRPFAEGEER